MRVQNTGLQHVKKFILVSSGKGGVGKSTIAANLAGALSKINLKVGLLDADISGPSQAVMWNLPSNVPLEVTENRELSLPFVSHNIKVATLATRISDQHAVQWRGPMASVALINLLCHTQWGELDCLLIDMPPGTGDIQVSICQKIPDAKVITVTTPQQVAVADTRRGMQMYLSQGLSLLGIIENMSSYVCENCGHISPLFGLDGAEQLCKEFTVPLLAKLPLDGSIRSQADLGLPITLAYPLHPVSEIYNLIAKQTWSVIND
jgi:ATP-binding protein involved in chromosome partitioning